MMSHLHNFIEKKEEVDAELDDVESKRNFIPYRLIPVFMDKDGLNVEENEVNHERDKVETKDSSSVVLPKVSEDLSNHVDSK
jgi:hypothetical protein